MASLNSPLKASKIWAVKKAVHCSAARHARHHWHKMCIHMNVSAHLALQASLNQPHLVTNGSPVRNEIASRALYWTWVIHNRAPLILHQAWQPRGNRRTIWHALRVPCGPTYAGPARLAAPENRIARRTPRAPTVLTKLSESGKAVPILELVEKCTCTPPTIGLKAPVSGRSHHLPCVD